jgi:hypothetical protein
MSGLALKAWNQAKSALRAKQGQIWQQYGFTGEFDENTGQAKNVGIDVKNPYGSYQTMLQNQGEQLDNADEDSQDRGIAGKGLGAQKGSRARWQHGAQQSQWGQQFAGANADIANQWQTAGFDYQGALLAAQRAAIQDAIANKAFNTPNEQPGQPTPTVGPGANPAATAQQNVTANQQLIHALTPGSSINEATRMAAQMPKPKPKPKTSPNLWFK